MTLPSRTTGTLRSRNSEAPSPDALNCGSEIALVTSVGKEWRGRRRRRQPPVPDLPEASVCDGEPDSASSIDARIVKSSAARPDTQRRMTARPRIRSPAASCGRASGCRPRATRARSPPERAAARAPRPGCSTTRSRARPPAAGESQAKARRPGAGPIQRDSSSRRDLPRPGLGGARWGKGVGGGRSLEQP